MIHTIRRPGKFLGIFYFHTETPVDNFSYAHQTGNTQYFFIQTSYVKFFYQKNVKASYKIPKIFLISFHPFPLFSSLSSIISQKVRYKEMRTFIMLYI